MLLSSDNTDIIEQNTESDNGLSDNGQSDNGQDNFPEYTPSLRDYKIVCAKLGLSMCFYFICRFLAGWVSSLLSGIADTFGDNIYSLISSLLVILLVYVIPLLFTALLFRSFTTYRGNYRNLYKKAKRLARALGTFPATYGFGYGIALLTLLSMYLISRNLGGQTYIEELLRPTVIEQPSSIISLLSMIFMLVIIAPVFEEFWVRGIMYDELKPYGTGIAIIISSILFGLMHGSLYMLFYTTALGFALGYIRYATGSLFIVTILHAIVNSIAAGALLFSTLTEMTNEENKLINTLSAIYLLAMLVTIIVGVVVFISKIPAIRKYRIENGWTQIGPWKKTVFFFISIPVILMMVFAFNEISGGLLLRLIMD